MTYLILLKYKAQKYIFLPCTNLPCISYNFFKFFRFKIYGHKTQLELSSLPLNVFPVSKYNLFKFKSCIIVVQFPPSEMFCNLKPKHNVFHFFLFIVIILSDTVPVENLIHTELLTYEYIQISILVLCYEVFSAH